MAQFDDIPIHQLHKADGYQIRNIDDSAIKHDHEDEDDNFGDISLKDRCFHEKWKVRQQAYNEINKLFNTYQFKNELSKEEEVYGQFDNPFETYGPLIEQMIKDNNLTAQYEGLTCLLSYVRLNKDIKGVTFACHSYLLDKIQHNKPNLKEVT